MNSLVSGSNLASAFEYSDSSNLYNSDGNLYNLPNTPGRITKKVSTKQKILNSSTHLFAMKGYTETTIREIAADIGMTEASIYNHFPSKNAILERILEEYSSYMASSFFDERKLYELSGDISADDILSCLMLVFPEDKVDYYIKKLYVMLQEQHRNHFVREFVARELILHTEQVLTTIINRLIELRILRQDTDIDSLAKIFSSLIYTFANRRLLGIGDDSSEFSGKGMVEIIRSFCKMMLNTCGIEN